MSVSFTALILAIAALFTAPAMLWLARGSSRLRSGLDGFVLVVVTGVVLLHLGPHALMHGGMPAILGIGCLLYTSPSPRDVEESRMPSSA